MATKKYPNTITEYELDIRDEFDIGIGMELDDILHSNETRAAILATEGRRSQIPADDGWER